MPGLVAKSREEAALTITIHPRTLADWIKEGCPGRPKKYEIAKIIKWARENKWQKATESDPLLAGPGESANLERYRGAKADLAEIDRDERRGRLCEPDVIRGEFLRVLRIFKDACEKIDQSFGPDAASVAIDAYEQMEQALLEALSDHDESSESE